MNDDDTCDQATCRIPVAPQTRDLVRAQKRGGESYDDLLRAMVAQYEPTEAAVGGRRD